MKQIISVTTLSGLLVALAAPVQAGYMRIKTEDQYRQTIADHKIMDKSGNWTIAKTDGTVTGKTAKGERIKGAWNWQKGMYCRHLIIGKADRGTDCLVLELDGNKGRFRNKMGKGERRSFVVN